MSQSESPVSAMFDIQRAAIKQGQQSIKQGFSFQRNTDRMAQSMLTVQEAFGRQTLEVSHAMTHTLLRSSAAMSGGADIREQQRSIDEVFSQLKESHTQLFDTMERGLDRSVEGFDDLSAEYVDAIEAGVEELIESNKTIESQSAQSFEEFNEQLEDQLERTKTIQEELDAQFEQQAERTESLLEAQTEQVERIKQQLEAEAEEIQQEIQEIEIEAGSGEVGAESEAETETEAEAEPTLELIDGLGETFRERLEAEGIDSIDALMESDTEHVAAVAEVSEERVEAWIEQAES